MPEAFFSAQEQPPQVQQNISFLTSVKAAINSFHRRTEVSNSDITAIRRQLRSDPWYPNLVALVYLFSIALGVDLLAIPTANGRGGIAPTTSLGFITIYYVLWLFLEFAILLVSTLIFFDQDLRAIWLKWSISRRVSKKPFSIIGRTVVFIVLAGISVVFYVFVCSSRFLPF
jgi:hypothetical protein